MLPPDNPGEVLDSSCLLWHLPCTMYRHRDAKVSPLLTNSQNYPQNGTSQLLTPCATPEPHLELWGWPELGRAQAALEKMMQSDADQVIWSTMEMLPWLSTGMLGSGAWGALLVP